MEQYRVFGKRPWRLGLLFGLLAVLTGRLWPASSPLIAHHVAEDGYWNTTGDLPANIVHHTVQSSYLQPDNDLVGFNVYTPPGYESSSDNYPVIYLLHGLSGNERNFFTWYPSLDAIYTMTSPFSLIEGTVAPPSNLTMPQAIVVLVNGGTESFYNDFPPDDPFHGPTSPFPIMSESILINEVIPYVDANFRTINHRGGRAIEGFSMGGRGALKLAFKYPDRFCSVVTYAAGALEANPVEESPYYGLFPVEERMSTIVDNQANAILASGLRIRMTVGDADANRGNDDLSAQLTGYGIPHEYDPALPGVEHDWRQYYDASGAYGLDRHRQCFLDNQVTPTATGTISPTPVDTPTATATDSPIATSTHTSTPTATVVPTATPTRTNTPTATSTGLPQATPPNTSTATATDIPDTPTSSPEATPSPTATPHLSVGDEYIIYLPIYWVAPTS